VKSLIPPQCAFGVLLSAKSMVGQYQTLDLGDGRRARENRLANLPRLFKLPGREQCP
jgi:hypothetical protein